MTSDIANITDRIYSCLHSTQIISRQFCTCRGKNYWTNKKNRIYFSTTITTIRTNIRAMSIPQQCEPEACVPEIHPSPISMYQRYVCSSTHFINHLDIFLYHKIWINVSNTHTDIHRCLIMWQHAIIHIGLLVLTPVVLW